MWKINKSILALITILSLLKSSCNAFECGVRKVSVNKVIIGGQSTSPGDWPWHVAIYHVESSSDKYVCGGTLISDIFVLTADHCVREDDFVISSRRIFVRLGLNNLRDLNPKTFQQHDVFRIHTYTSTDMLKNDIAILELARQAEFTDYVKPVCLNQEEDLTRQFGSAIGWGVDETGEISRILRSQRMPVVSTNQCLENNDGVFRYILDSSIFCAGYTNGTTVCNGDSGGGLHFERNGVWYVGGIISFTAPRDSSNRCHLKSFAGFTNIYHFLPWIRSITRLGSSNENKERTDFNQQEPYYHPLLPQDCGRYLTNRIYGGTRADLYEFPWVVRLLYVVKRTGNLDSVCHGSLINKRYVLTSAWCAVNSYYKPVQIDLGDYELNEKIDCNFKNVGECAPPIQRVFIESIIVHPNYNGSYQNDIALIRLYGDIQFEDHIQPVCLPVTQSLRQQKLEHGIVAGWGNLERNGVYPNILQTATVRVIANSECQRNTYDGYYTGNDIICTGYKTPNTCNWDQGTPLGYPTLYNGRLRFVQFGITSLVGCEEYYSVYTFVPNYINWILSNLKS